MNDYSSIDNSAGLLKDAYNPGDEQLEALRRRQKMLAAKVKAQSLDPIVSDVMSDSD